MKVKSQLLDEIMMDIHKFMDFCMCLTLMLCV